jgi:hypothetical protein
LALAADGGQLENIGLAGRGIDVADEPFRHDEVRVAGLCLPFPVLGRERAVETPGLDMRGLKSRNISG